ncbi:MAG: TatD family hydrolase [Ardenticatenales bacterium]|nr:TatD family hydrolase [Ardenticatenales bacterium]
MTQGGRSTSDGGFDRGLYLGPDAATRLRTPSVDRGRASQKDDDTAWSPSDAVDLALVDTHCHLDADAFADDPTTAILGRARRAGVTRLVTIGTDLESSARAVRLARHHHEIWATVGIDPNDLPIDGSVMTEAMLAAVESLACAPRVVAIGEIGLDYYWNRTSHEVQRAAFEAQLGLAARVGMPVVIHSRDADADTVGVLSAWAGGDPWGGHGVGDAMGGVRPLGVLHCFSGDVDLAMRYVALGFLISLSGIVTFKSNAQTHAVARELPLEALVLETDAPYLAPHPHRGRRNEPAYVRLIAEHVAALRGEDVATVARATSANAARLFGWGAI